MPRTPDTDLREELERLELDLETRRKVSEHLEQLDEILPGCAIVVMPPDANPILERAARKRGVSVPCFISEALGHVTGLMERGVWVGDMIRQAFAAIMLEELQRRAVNATQRKGKRHDD